MRIVIDLQGAQTESRFRGIGRYSLSIVKAIVRNKGEHEIIIALSNLLPDAIEDIRIAFDGLLPQKNIRVWHGIGPTRECDNGNDWRRKVSEVLREAFLLNLQPDMILITSLFEGYVDGAVTSIKNFDAVTKVAVILYDLIPYIHRDKYLIHNSQYAKHYLSKIEYLKKADLLLGISQSSSSEAIEHLTFNQKQVFNISSAVDESFKIGDTLNEKKQQLFDKYKITRGTIIYAPGGFDVRKNFENLIKAYARLPKHIKESYQLVIVSKVDEGNKERLTKLTKDLGLNQNDLLLTGYVNDEDLIIFYRMCDLFVFPSIHEGFGLPVLEAMQCGAIVIGSNTTSIPEVIGYEEALFDPYNIESISQKIKQVLTDENLRSKLKEHFQKQVTKFSWNRSAKLAIGAMEKNFGNYLTTTNTKRKRLAYFSPLPPQRSGISDYSKELLPYLADYYDIVLIIDSTECENTFDTKIFEEQTLKWFFENFGVFDRVLFHFGNSPFHTYMIEALKYTNGVVMLHDFFLSSLYAYEEIINGQDDFWSRAIYASHGYQALQKRFEENAEEQIKLNFPANYDIFKKALGILSHSQYSKNLFNQYYGLFPHQNWEIIPFVKKISEEQGKDVVRNKLKFSNDDFVICSFGFLDETKLNHQLLDAFISSKLSKMNHCKLVFVGQNHGGEYGRQILDVIEKNNLNDKVFITGWVDAKTYNDYLTIVDVSVQLRTKSRGETSAAIFDCMSHGIPTIVNANGTFAELDKNSVLMLEDHFSVNALKNALEKMYNDDFYRKKLSENSRTVIKAKHNPAICAKHYFEAIEKFYDNQAIDINNLISSVIKIDDFSKDDSTLMSIATIISENFQPLIKQKQLLIDISTVSRNDLRTGIERVVRAQLIEFFQNPPKGFRVEPVYLTDAGGFWHYRYAREFTCKLLNIPQNILFDESVDVGKGDVFFCADFYRDGIIEASKSGLYKNWRERGVCINFEVYDLLPITNPEFFPDSSCNSHFEWIKSICINSDKLICISNDVKESLEQLINHENLITGKYLSIYSVPLGADIESSVPSFGMEKDANIILEKISLKSTFLMVGTIEPRKGYLQVLGAFENLWEQGIDVNLVIVGKEGWKGLPDEQRKTIPQIIDKITKNLEFSKRFFWLEGISDEYLEKVYSLSTCLLAASEAEGFGLPLIEAAQYKIPIIARDIPVFREVASTYAYYFDNDNEPIVLAKAIEKWLTLYQNGQHPKSDDMPWLTWNESAKSLMKNILGED